MNGPLTTFIGTVAAMIASAIVAWFVKNNLIPADQVPAFTAGLAATIVTIIGAAVLFLQTKASTLSGHMAAVNASGVVKSVAATEDAPMLAAPPKPDEAKIAAVNAIDGVKVVAQTAPATQVATVPPITK